MDQSHFYGELLEKLKWTNRIFVILFAGMRLLPLFLALVLSVDCSLPQYQTDSLLAFYDATGGPFWINSTNWNITADPCSGLWHGVICDLLGQNVTALDLPYNNLTGSLPDLVLPSLKTL